MMHSRWVHHPVLTLRCCQKAGSTMKSSCTGLIMSIPSARPILLLYDGHSSHISIEVIQKARENVIHLLCLPSHGTHILQPLDVSVMSSLKLHFSKACKDFLAKNPGRVITEYDISGILGKHGHRHFLRAM